MLVVHVLLNVNRFLLVPLLSVQEVEKALGPKQSLNNSKHFSSVLKIYLLGSERFQWFICIFRPVPQQNINHPKVLDT